MPTRTRAPFTAAVTAVAAMACALGVTACSGGGSQARAHGRVLAALPIPFRPSHAGGAERVALGVRTGQRFAIKVATSDGPYWWTQAARPDGRILRVAGNFDDGHCPAGQVGCRVPYFHTLVARSPGTTTMTWRYHAPGCAVEGQKMTQASRRCANAATVIFTVTVR